MINTREENIDLFCFLWLLILNAFKSQLLIVLLILLNKPDNINSPVSITQLYCLKHTISTLMFILHFSSTALIILGGRHCLQLWHICVSYKKNMNLGAVFKGGPPERQYFHAF